MSIIIKAKKQMTEINNNNDFYEFVIQIKSKIRNSQVSALRAVNKELIELYCEIGKSIVQKQEEQGWDISIVEMLAHKLRLEFPSASGFSIANLWRMRNFYLTYIDNVKLTQLVREIGWSHNLLIIERCKDNLER